MRIGLLTDTHLPSTIRDLWDEVKVAFAGVDLILHGGDIVAPRVLDWLEEIAPTLAARGNNDSGWDDPRVLDIQWLDIDGWRLAMIHDMEPEDRPLDYLKKFYLKGEHADIIITGHTHFERLDYREGVLQINSGSPTHPHLWSTRLGTVGLLELAPGTISAQVIKLGESPGLANPGIELVFDLHPHRAATAIPASSTVRY
jgi:putative phosphoesterase